MPRSSLVPSRSRRLLLTLATLVCLAPGALFADPRPARRGKALLLPVPGTVFQHGQALNVDAVQRRDPSQGRLKPEEVLVGMGLLSRYQLALERESRRTLDRDPFIFLAGSRDEDGYLLRRARREAQRVFDGANGRLISDIAEDLIQEAVALRTARAWVEGVRFDVMSAGGVRVRAGHDEGSPRGREEDAGSNGLGVKASLGLVALGAPRLEIRTTIPGDIRTRIEVPLSSPGIRAAFSRRVTSSLRGTLSLGVEDAGADLWVTAGLGVRF
ncbi:MAG TPA: hypothetical protein VGK94_05620 [Candidatus Polarisedimenticolia bacterium]